MPVATVQQGYKTGLCTSTDQEKPTYTRFMAWTHLHVLNLYWAEPCTGPSTWQQHNSCAIPWMPCGLAGMRPNKHKPCFNAKPHTPLPGRHRLGICRIPDVHNYLLAARPLVDSQDLIIKTCTGRPETCCKRQL